MIVWLLQDLINGFHSVVMADFLRRYFHRCGSIKEMSVLHLLDRTSFATKVMFDVVGCSATLCRNNESSCFKRSFSCSFKIFQVL